MSAAYPFVNFKSAIQDGINNAGAVALNSAYACILDSIIVSNKTNGVVLASLNIIREVSSVPTSYYLLEKFKLLPYQSFDFLASQGQTSSVVYLQPNDVLFAQSDAISNIFSVVVSYRELTEITTAMAKILDLVARRKISAEKIDAVFKLLEAA